MRFYWTLWAIALPYLCLAQSSWEQASFQSKPFVNFTQTSCATLLARSSDLPAQVYQSLDGGAHWSRIPDSEGQTLSNRNAFMLVRQQNLLEYPQSASWENVFLYFDCAAGHFVPWKTESCFQYWHGCLKDAALELRGKDFVFTQTEGCYGIGQKQTQKYLRFGTGIHLQDLGAQAPTPIPIPPVVSLPNGETSAWDFAALTGLLLASPTGSGGIWYSADNGKNWQAALEISPKIEPQICRTLLSAESDVATLRENIHSTLEATEQLLFFPNPANESFTLKLPAKQELPVRIELLDVQGRTVQHTEMNVRQQEINTASLLLDCTCLVESIKIRDFFQNLCWYSIRANTNILHLRGGFG